MVTGVEEAGGFKGSVYIHTHMHTHAHTFSYTLLCEGDVGGGGGMLI